MKIFHVIFHLVTYYIAWFACILSSANEIPWVGAGIALAIFALQWVWQKKFDQTEHLLSFVLMFTLSGFFIDTLFLNLNLISFRTNPWPIPISPPWMMMLWVNFSMLLYACLRYLFDYPRLLGVLSFVGFPVAYFTGTMFGAASLPVGAIVLLAYGTVWGLMLPLLIGIHKKLKRNSI